MADDSEKKPTPKKISEGPSTPIKATIEESPIHQLFSSGLISTTPVSSHAFGSPIFVSSSGIAIGGTNSLLSPFGANVVDDKTLAKYRQLEQETVALRTQLEEQAGFLGQEKIGLRKRKPSFKSWNRR